MLSVNEPKYTLFPPGVDLITHLGQRGIKVELEVLAKEGETAKEKVRGATKSKKARDGILMKMRTRTGQLMSLTG